MTSLNSTRKSVLGSHSFSFLKEALVVNFIAFARVFQLSFFDFRQPKKNRPSLLENLKDL